MGPGVGAQRGGGLCQEDVIMTAVAPLESRHPRLGQSHWWLCVCVCVICTFRGGSLCSVGLDASFGSGLLRPLCDVVSLPSAESEPLYFAG